MTAVMPEFIGGNPFGLGGPVAPTVLDTFCGDGDGCTVRLQMLVAAVPATEVRGAQRVLFKSGTHWTTDVDTGVDFVDGDASLKIVLETREAPTGLKDTCEFSDFDYTPGSGDTGQGFTLLAMYWATGVQTPGFTCVLTIID